MKGLWVDAGGAEVCERIPVVTSDRRYASDSMDDARATEA